MLKVKRLSSKARIPEYSTIGSACFNIFTNILEPVSIVQREPVLVSTGISFEIENGFVVIIYNTIENIYKNVRFLNGFEIIDNDYRGEIIIPIYNDSNYNFNIKPSQKIAQGIIVAAQQAEIKEITSCNNGFGLSENFNFLKNIVDITNKKH